MIKKFKELVLTQDTSFDESIEVEGDIKCENKKFNLTVAGNIDAWNIDAWNIDARNIDARNIDARNIDARNIVFCEKIKLKDKTKGKIKAKVIVKNRFQLKQKEWKSD